MENKNIKIKRIFGVCKACNNTVEFTKVLHENKKLKYPIASMRICTSCGYPILDGIV